MSESDVRALLAELGKTFVPECGALKHLGASVSCENDGSYYVETPIQTNYNEKPTIVEIIGLTSIKRDAVTLEWIEANDDTTSQKNIVYKIYTSKDKDFTPNSTTLVKTLKGENYTTIDGLDEDELYFFKIIAIDKDNLKSISYEKSIKTSSYKLEVSPKTKYIKSVKNIAQNQLVVENNSTIQNNDILVSEENGGFARKIIGVTNVNGQKTLETRPASLAEIFTDMSVHTSVKLVDLEQSKQQQTSKSYQKTLQKNGFQLSKKWGSGLTLFDKKSNVSNTQNKLYKTKQMNKTKVKEDIESEEAFTVKVPKYYAFDIEDKKTEKISLYFIPKEEKEYLMGYDDFYYEICNVTSEIIVPNSSFYFFERGVKSSKNKFNFDFSKYPNKIKELVRAEPYTIEFKVRTAKNGTCSDENPIYEKTYPIKRDIYIGTGSIALSGGVSETIPFSGYEGKNLTITNQLTGTYEPELIIDSFVENGQFKNGKVEVVAKINLVHEIKAMLEASKGFEYKKTFIDKKFIKVIPAGPVPLIFNGSFEVALVLEGSATGKIDITNTLINDYEFHAGFQYDKATDKWNYIGKSENGFEIKLKGEAGADVMLKVSLQPKLTLKLYDSVGGGIALDPYAKAEASGRMVKSISANIEHSTMTGIRTQFINDQFISVDKVDASLGVDLRWYVKASIFDYTLASYPDNLDETKASTYAKAEIIKPQMIASLPKLSIKDGDYLNEIGKDSRLMIIEGEAKPIVNSLYTAFGRGSKYIINHEKWSFAELIRPRQEMLTFVDENKSLVLVDEVDSDYQIRMLEESTLGLPHAVETTFNTEDKNYNKIPDSWEKAYDIYELGNTANSGELDSDGDNLSNIEEFKHGTHPDKKDSDADGCTDKEEIDANYDPLNKSSRPERCLSDKVELITPNLEVKSINKNKKSVVLSWNKVEKATSYTLYIGTEKGKTKSNPFKTLTTEELEKEIDGLEFNKEYYATVIAKKDTDESESSNEVSFRITKDDVVSLSLGSNITIQEGKGKVVLFKITDTAKKIETITCFSTPSIGNLLSNTNKKASFTAPKYDDISSFAIRCQAKDTSGKVVANDSVNVTVTKKPVVEPTNEAPTVSLPSSLPSSHTISPTVYDEDVSTLKYEWQVTWNGDKKEQGSSSALNASSLTLTTPTLDPGESGSVKVTLKVTDEEGLSDEATETYTYSVEKEEAIKFISDNFDDNTVLPRGSTKTLTWTIQNKSNVDLHNVKLKLTQTADALTVSDIEPSTIDSWEKGKNKTFSVEVTVPNNITEGTHKQLWNFYYDTTKPLPYEGESASASIYFQFKTTNPNELVGRLITDKKLVTPNETVTSLLEITSGNAPYKVEVNWGDGKNETFDDIAKNTDEGMTKSLTHKYGSEGSYSVTVKVTDNANKKATFTETIKVETSTAKTDWTADVHDIDTDERASNIAIIVENVESGGKTYGKYHTNWSPTKKTDSKEYFVKYRLPIPPKLLMLNKKMRVTVQGQSSDIEAYDREINFKTSDSKEYTASIRHKDFKETLADGTVIKGGYFTTKDLLTGSIEKEKAEFLNSGEVLLDGVYSMGTYPDTETINVEKGTEHTTLFNKDISLSQNWLTELDVTFKGNGTVKFVLIEYDLDDNGEFSSEEKLVLSTQSKEVDWSVFGSVEPTPSTTTLPVKKTGQTTTYYQHDDGYYKKGVQPNYSRNGEIVTDHVTGLEWQDNEDVKTVTKTWEEAKTYCTDEVHLGGYNDWRLPTVMELKSIVDYGKYYPSIDSVFVNTHSGYYWSSTSNSNNSSNAWIVSFSNGSVGDYYETHHNYVRCVRAGQ